jgi:RNA polymerase sigma-70 factor (ECF subfamily)
MDGSDDELMAAIVAGDREAFGRLYRRRWPDVYRFALHMTGVPAVAEDVAQDVFMAVIQDGRRYQVGRSTVVAWLLGIARNHARRRLWRDRRLDPLPEVEHELSETLMVEHDPAVHLARDRQIDTVRRALRGLPVSYREVVVLCDLQELTYVEAAQVVGCAIGTIRSRLHRGRTLLGAQLRHEQRGLMRRSTAPGWVI